jgi:hypothetical protein
MHARVSSARWAKWQLERAVKVDWANAFNTVRRDALLCATRDNFPHLQRYVEVAYGSVSSLRFGKELLPSQTGVHQGDPLGPLLFSAALGVMLKEVLTEERLAGLIFNGWYLDDGLIAGAKDVVLDTLEAIAAAGALIGLKLNWRKCEVVSCDPSIGSLFRDMQVHLPTSWEILGADVGTAGGRDHAAKIVNKAIRRVAHPAKRQRLIVWEVLREIWEVIINYSQKSKISYPFKRLRLLLSEVFHEFSINF